MLEKKANVIPWGWGKRGKRGHSRFPTTDLGMRIQKIESQEHL